MENRDLPPENAGRAVNGFFVCAGETGRKKFGKFFLEIP
jgi:hypothetical protein